MAVAIGVALALVPLLLFTFFGLNTRLLADDYAYLGLAQRLGTWEAMLTWRGLWNGSYSNFLLYGLLAPLGAAVPPFFALVLITSTFVAYSWLINTVCAYLGIAVQRRAIVVSLAALSVAATINAFHIAQAFYWLTAAIVYTWPGVTMLLGMALAWETARRLRGNFGHALAALAVAIYAFFNAGYSELFLICQFTAVALTTIFVLFSLTGPKRKSLLILSVAACVGTLVSFAMQLSAPGFAIRSSVSVNDGYRVIPVRELSQLLERTLDTTLLYAGHQESIAGYMLVMFAGMFLTLAASRRFPADSISLRLPVAATPLVFALTVQLLFVPILWSHSSDSIQLLGQFSYGFMTVVGINLLLIAVLLTLLWRRDLRDNAFNRRSGLMVYCSLVLLLVCALFVLTQIRAIHYKASSYLFFSAVSMLIMLASQLTKTIDEPGLKRLVLVTAYITASALLIITALLAVKLFGAGYVVKRTLSSVTFVLMIAGLLNGLTLGALIHRTFCQTNAKTIWIRLIRLFSLIVASTIAAGIAIGQAPRIAHVRNEVDIWHAQHQEIIRMRDEGDPALYTESFARLLTDHVGSTPPKYKTGLLGWRPMLFYGLDMRNEINDCQSPEAIMRLEPRVRVVCKVINKDGHD